MPSNSAHNGQRPGARLKAAGCLTYLLLSPLLIQSHLQYATGRIRRITSLDFSLQSRPERDEAFTWLSQPQRGKEFTICPSKFLPCYYRLLVTCCCSHSTLLNITPYNSFLLHSDWVRITSLASKLVSATRDIIAPVKFNHSDRCKQL